MKITRSPLEIEDSTIPKNNIKESYRGWGCVFIYDIRGAIYEVERRLEKFKKLEES